MKESDVDMVGQERDDALLAELRDAVAQRDGVPDAVLTAARESLTWLTVDAELAALSFDSAVDASAALVRDGATTAARDHRLLTFEVGDATVEVEVAGTGAALRLVAQVLPAGPAEVEVRRPGSAVSLRTDEHGRLASVDVERGPLSLRVRLLPDGPTIVTEWVTV